MQENTATVSIRGKVVNVPCEQIQGRGVVVNGRWLRIATILGCEWLAEDPVPNPEEFLPLLRRSQVQADLFEFAQQISDTAVRYPQYHMEWDNAAVIPLTSYADWWESLSQESRRNVRTAAKRGIRVEVVTFDDKLVQGIKGIYDETPMRQGRLFWHYGKAADAVKRENATYLDRSRFLAAYFNDELVGFIKMVRVGDAFSIMQILSKNRHFDKRPPHALIAKAVEVACLEGAGQLVYCKYVYGRRQGSSITEFKRRLGFQQVNYPRYFVPLTWKGSVALKTQLHRGLLDLLPGRVSEVLLTARERYYQWKLGCHSSCCVSSPSCRDAPPPR